MHTVAAFQAATHAELVQAKLAIEHQSCLKLIQAPSSWLCLTLPLPGMCKQAITTYLYMVDEG